MPLARAAPRRLALTLSETADAGERRASDTGWTHGSGPEVAGPMLPLVLAMAGRKGALDELHGDGVAALRERP